MAETIETVAERESFYTTSAPELLVVDGVNINVGNYIINKDKVEWIARVRNKELTTLSLHSDLTIRCRNYLLYEYDGKLRVGCWISGFISPENTWYEQLKNKIDAYKQLGAGI